MDAKPTILAQRQALRHGHDLIPLLAVAGIVDVEHIDHPAFAVGRGRRSMHSPGRHLAVIESPVGVGREAVCVAIVVAKEVLAAVAMTEEQQDVLVANRLEVRTCAIVVRSDEWCLRQEWTPGFPMFEIARRPQRSGWPSLWRKAQKLCRPS